MSRTELLAVEAQVNQAILANYQLRIAQKPLDQAINEGATALFGEKYEGIVRTISIGDDQPLSYELCGGTHVEETSDIGLFLITYEGSIAAGIRRIEAVTGRGALAAAQALRAREEQAASLLETIRENVPQRVLRLLEELRAAHKEIDQLNRKLARESFEALLDAVQEINDVPFLAAQVEAPEMDTMREMADWFRDKRGDSIIVLGAVIDGKPRFIAATTKALTRRGVHAGQLVKQVAQVVGGGGGGRPDMAQAGGQDAEKIEEALAQAQKAAEAMLR